MAISTNAQKIDELANPNSQSGLEDETDDEPVPIPDTNACVDDYTLETNEYCGEWVGATLGMLPLWGQAPSADDVYF